MKTKSSTFITGPDCKERFLPMDFEGAQPLLEKGVLLGGYSHVFPPYERGWKKAEHHLLLHSIEGDARLRVRNKEMRIRQKECILLPAGSSYLIHLPSPGWSIAWLYLKADIAEFTPSKTVPYKLHIPNIEALKPAMEALIQESFFNRRDSVGTARTISQTICNLLDRAFSSQKQTRVSIAKHKFTSLLMRIDQDLMYDWSVEEMAAMVGISPPHLYRLARRFHNKAPMQLVASMRMKRAVQLLNKTNCRLDDIADLIGYRGAFAFSKAFKKWSGKSPKAFRDEHRLQQAAQS